MKISMSTTNKRLENAKYKWYIICKWWEKDWAVIVPFTYFDWPKFLVTKWSHSLGKGLFIEWEWYVYHSRERAIEKWESEKKLNDGREDFAFDFIS